VLARVCLVAFAVKSVFIYTFRVVDVS
jgi:hypothetical protein